ncbi:hypothetical protein BBO99_00001750 [Phytophthora kernoviae]|uniref:EF-hand domain-containing protein n=2 Tax=Phytophthora kernoviae TaxID=325452 RepID=A0A421GZP5_9STRA|nr:hypothetical protein G195_002267 [Phytophthora kernoviae 00238/432]KAG2530954.1 hypothetical protein JM16_001399 [Phytophthora kernoviae]KAG2532012.1 hypothetical protein JM18_001481 [Phytophthora kernoviae]RLN36730.1 hypothetical protein BBI17_001497 [Phytophthora kernoviae]RLN83882.1 hypothetical protein BBO99_00001750 [Phytophthora kernoviae]
MGVSQSKSGGGDVRWQLESLVPRCWAELEQMHLRFQQEAHRRRADPLYQFFLPFPVFRTVVTPLCPDKDKLQLLAMFEVLDRKKTRKLAAMDFFSGLALLVDAKKPQKLEFVLSLLDNGGLKTLNRCELTMVVVAASRGFSMFAPGADILLESTMRPLIRRLFGEADEVLRQTIINKALADPEILFFMSDLEAGVATSSGELLVQQAKLMSQMAYLDYQAARVKPSGTGDLSNFCFIPLHCF